MDITLRDLVRINPAIAQYITDPKTIALAIEIGAPIINKLCPAERQSSKGIAGELAVEDIIRRNFGTVDNVTKNPKSGDLTVFANHNKIIIEVKNYINTVPTSAIEKFQRDIRATGAAGGVFISIRAPIAGMSNFVINHEGTAPVIYIVSADECAITLAVNMISQLITTSQYISAEAHDRSAVSGNVFEISRAMDVLTQAHNSLQVNISDITAQLVKTSSQFASAISSVRTFTDNLRAELFNDIVSGSRVLTQLQSNNYYVRQPPNIKKYIAQIISSQGDINWKITARKLRSSRMDINIGATIGVSVPRISIDGGAIIRMLDTMGKKIVIADGTITIELGDDTYETINSILSPPAIPQ